MAQDVNSSLRHHYQWLFSQDGSHLHLPQIDISSPLSLDAEVSSRIAKATSIMAKLNKRLWSSNHLAENCTHTRPMYSSLFYMAVRPGQCLPVRKRDLTASTSTASGASFTFPGRTEWPIKRSLNKLVSQAYSPFSVRDISGGWATSVEWILVLTLRTCCTVNWVRVLTQLGDHTSDSKDLCKWDMLMVDNLNQ